MLNLEWFRTFKVVYEAGTLSAAAQALYISQPGVSLHLNSLESYTGHRLFERESRKVTPTDRGIILYDYIIDALVELEEIEKKFNGRSRTGKVTVSIGMCYATFQYILEKYVCDLPFNLITRFGDCLNITEDLASGAIDFIITSKPNLDPNLVFVPFAEERIVLIAGSNTNTAALDELKASNDLLGINKWLSDQKWFATAADMHYLKTFWLGNFKEEPGFSPDVILPHYQSILRCLKNGLGFTVIPENLFKSQIVDNSVKVAWAGCKELINTLYFGKRKKPMNAKEIEYLEHLLTENWFG